MAGKILVNVRQPSSGIVCDALIPGDVRLEMIVKALGGMLEQLSKGMFAADGSMMLWSERTGEFLNPGMTAEENGIINGDVLLQI